MIYRRIIAARGYINQFITWFRQFTPRGLLISQAWGLIHDPSRGIGLVVVPASLDGEPLAPLCPFSWLSLHQRSGFRVGWWDRQESICEGTSAALCGWFGSLDTGFLFASIYCGHLWIELSMLVRKSLGRILLSHASIQVWHWEQVSLPQMDELLGVVPAASLIITWNRHSDSIRWRRRHHSFWHTIKIE